MTLRNSSGALVKGATVQLQRRLGRAAWTTVYSMKTGSTGKATRVLTFKKRRTEQWRWYLPGNGATVPVGSSSAVTIKVK
jgi:hypothetical protein